MTGGVFRKSLQSILAWTIETVCDFITEDTKLQDIANSKIRTRKSVARNKEELSKRRFEMFTKTKTVPANGTPTLNSVCAFRRVERRHH